MDHLSWGLTSSRTLKLNEAIDGVARKEKVRVFDFEKLTRARGYRLHDGHHPISQALWEGFLFLLGILRNDDSSLAYTPERN